MYTFHKLSLTLSFSLSHSHTLTHTLSIPISPSYTLTHTLSPSHTTHTYTHTPPPPQAAALLKETPALTGVMVGRAVVNAPFSWSDSDSVLYGKTDAGEWV
jgi:hypothetical protein